MWNKPELSNKTAQQNMADCADKITCDDACFREQN